MRRQYIAVAVVVAAVLVAGCAGGTGGDGATTTSPGTTGATADGTTTTAEPTATTTESVDRSAEAVRDAAVGAIEGVETYRVSSTQEAVVKANLVRRSTQTSNAVFDRENRELRVNRITNTDRRNQRVTTWVVDRTAYSRSEAFTRQFGSKWVEVDVSANFSRFWTFQDTLARQRAVLENASTLSVAGTETVNGTSTVVLRANVSSEDYAELARRTFGSAAGGGAGNLTIHRADFTFYISQETDLPVRSTAQINTTLEVNGRSIDQNASLTVDYYGYGEPASIDLPEGADSAVNLSNRSTSRLLAGAVGGPDGAALDRATAPTTDAVVAAEPRASPALAPRSFGLAD